MTQSWEWWSYPPFLDQPPFSKIPPFLEIRDVPTFHRSIGKTKVLNIIPTIKVS